MAVVPKIDQTESPLPHLKECPVIWLLYARGEIYFCTNCADGCLKDELCSNRAAVAMGFSSQEIVNKHFGHLSVVTAQCLSFEEARTILRQVGGERFPLSSIHLYFTNESSEKTTYLIYDPNLAQ